MTTKVTFGECNFIGPNTIDSQGDGPQEDTESIELKKSKEK
jgi:hypothetical protein